MPTDVASLFRSKLAREKGTIRKDWGGRLRVALIYPGFYRLGMSNLGYQVVYQIFNRRPEVVAERVFLPEGQEMSLLLQSGKPLFSMESQAPLEKFDLLAFSLSFENDYVNVLKILELGKIPLFSEAREGPFPLVMAGGVTTFLNPEPLAPFIDFFVIGEAEAVLDQFIDLCLEYGAGSVHREEIKAKLAVNVKALYVPTFYEPHYHEDGTLKAFLPKRARIPEKILVACERPLVGNPPRSVISTPDTAFSDMVLVEVGRGCGRSCRFCAAGYVYRPPGIWGERELRGALEEVTRTARRVGLVGAAVSDVPEIESLASMIVDRGRRFSVSSLRADSLSKDLIEQLKRTGQKTLAIAPEAGSERLRRVINKHLTQEQIGNSVSLISRTGHFALRLYFLVGLPTETSEDVAEIADLVKFVKEQMMEESVKRGRVGQIRLSVNCFVPKPFTPFQWFGMEHIHSLKEKQSRLGKALAREGGVKVNFDAPKWAYVQALLSLGDRRVSEILFKAYSSNGRWAKAYASSTVHPDFFVYRPKGLDEMLPWDFIEHGISKEHLIKEYQLGLEGRESQACQVGQCFRCGVCASKPA